MIFGIRNSTEVIAVCLLAAGGLCAFALRKLKAGPARGVTKLTSFLLIGIGFLTLGLADYRLEHVRTITPATVSGTLTNIHQVDGGPKQNAVQHYNVDTANGISPDLHDHDALFFMKARNGEHVEVTYTQESGYVSHLRIVGGPGGGYEFDEPDVQNFMSAYFFMLLGIVVAGIGIFKWIVDHNADPKLED